MKFSTPLIQGTLIKRYKRFLADIQLADGSIVIAHCPNTGAMTGCAEPGWKVWLSPSNNPKRKLLFTWEVVLTDQLNWIGINTQKANILVKEAIQETNIAELAGYKTLQGEVRFGEENSRIDFLLTDPEKSDCYVEVKSVTLLDNNAGYFPDSKTLRGQKQHSGIQSVQVAKHIDPDYAKELKQAMLSGVQILCYDCKISPEKIYINQSLPFFS
jgi:sugar fermentation stimulation protein A